MVLVGHSKRTVSIATRWPIINSRTLQKVDDMTLAQE
jgi:hypothetical protein